MAGLVCGLGLCVSWAQESGQVAGDRNTNPLLSATSTSTSQLLSAAMKEKPGRGRRGERTLTSEDRRTVIAGALHSKSPRPGERDCSHLVHAIYQKAGFPYAYAPSDDLYDGIEGFQRVSRPKAGDLVVWRGHVGIVIRPSRHAFFSFLNSGPGIDDYRSRYWKGRGEARFYKYVKTAGCVRCTVARGHNGE
jgi:cell wall-associated NlpC family hydrolase